VQLTGCRIANPGFEAAAGWTFTRQSGRVNGGQHIADPAYSSSVHSTVGALYAS
jgi:hypothetical protein